MQGAEVAPRLNRLRRLAQRMDARWEIFGVRFGWDALVGLIPGLGDVLCALVSFYIVLGGWRLGVPFTRICRMLLNIAIEAVLGSVPVAGDLLDVSWKANLRNIALIEDSLGVSTPEQASQGRMQRGDYLLVLLALLLLLIATLFAFDYPWYQL